MYKALKNIDLFDSPQCDRLATQMAEGRYLLPISTMATGQASLVQLWEDGYRGWIKSGEWRYLQAVGAGNYQMTLLDAATIQARLPQVLQHIQRAQAQPHAYLWGGTVPPHYDCSGLMQWAFAAVGVWIPRDAYQQEAFAVTVAPESAQLGDLIFFGRERATHVGFYLGDGEYIHSSGKDWGHNGIAISSLTGDDPVSQRYKTELRGWGRIVRNLQGGDYCVP
ncbi:MAG: NlpC/P60 family protein [Pseudanabaenaceae cyanobacterium]